MIIIPLRDCTDPQGMMHSKCKALVTNLPLLTVTRATCICLVGDNIKGLFLPRANTNKKMNALTTLWTTSTLLLIATLGHPSHCRDADAIIQIYHDIAKSTCNADEDRYKAFYDAVRHNATRNASYDHSYPDDIGNL